MEAESQQARTFGIIVRFDESFNTRVTRLANRPLNLQKIGHDPGRAHADVRVEFPYLPLCRITGLKPGADPQPLKKAVYEIRRMLVGKTVMFDRLSVFAERFLCLRAEIVSYLLVAHGIAHGVSLCYSDPESSLPPGGESRGPIHEEDVSIRQYGRSLSGEFFYPRVVLAYDEQYIGQHTALEQSPDLIMGEVCAVELAAIGDYGKIYSRGEVDDYQF